MLSLCGHFLACCQNLPVPQKGSEAAFLYYFVLVKKSGRKLVPHPNWPLFLISAEPTSAERVRGSLIIKIPQGPGNSFNPLLWLGHQKPLLLERPGPSRAWLSGPGQDSEGLLCGRSFALPPGAHSSQPPAPRMLVTSGGCPSALTP